LVPLYLSLNTKKYSFGVQNPPQYGRSFSSKSVSAFVIASCLLAVGSSGAKI
jgi:hypothetical protein